MTTEDKVGIGLWEALFVICLVMLISFFSVILVIGLVIENQVIVAENTLNGITARGYENTAELAYRKELVIREMSGAYTHYSFIKDGKRVYTLEYSIR